MESMMTMYVPWRLRGINGKQQELRAKSAFGELKIVTFNTMISTVMAVSPDGILLYISSGGSYEVLGGKDGQINLVKIR